MALIMAACSKEANKPADTAVKTEEKTTASQTESDQTPDRVSYLEISAKTEKCDAGVAVLDCLQVKHVDYKDGQKTYKNNEWENFYDGIEGFNHDATKQVLIKVKEYDIANPPADGSSIRYVLDEVIETQPAK